MLTESDLQDRLKELKKEDTDTNERDLQTKIDFLEKELIPECQDAKDMGEVYEDRNVAVLGFLRSLKELDKLAEKSKYVLDWDLEVGWRENSKTDGDWVAVCARLPEGQVSWTLKREDVPDWMSEVDMDYDGHSVEEKLERVRNFCNL